MSSKTAVVTGPIGVGGCVNEKLPTPRPRSEGQASGHEMALEVALAMGDAEERERAERGLARITAGASTAPV